MLDLRWFALGLSACVAACSASGSGSSPGNAGGSSGSGAAGGASGSSGSSASGGSGGGTCQNQCSADLKQVLDCNGGLVADCPADKACAFASCGGDPCIAAQSGGTTTGCDFWALKTDVIPQGAGACFAAFVVNTWDEHAHIKVERGGAELPTSSIRIPKGQGQNLTYTPYDPALGLPPGEVAILFLSRGPGFPFIPDCPIPAAIPLESGVLGTGRGTAFHITTDRPVVAYQILPYGGGASAMTSATLLLPTGVWQDNYVAINAYLKNTLNNGQPSLNVLAAEDGTEVTILPKVDLLPGQSVQGAPAGTPVTYQLARGEYVQLTQDAELSGSPIHATHPVALFGSSSCMNVPVDREACDTGHQQIPPLRALGSEYVGARHKNRTGASEEIPWRIMGVVDGTTLTWTPATPAGAPTTLALGQVVEFRTPDLFVVKSQDPDHPFYLSTYMTGGGPFNGTGDPEWVNSIPADQYLKDYVLFTDPTYSDTNLVVTRKRDSNGNFGDVTLGCRGVLTGWQPVGDHELTYVDLVTGNFADVGSCSNGRHVMSSPAPFGVTVWGWGSIPGFPGSTNLYTQYVSYAYPAGAGVKPINQVEIPIPH